MTYIMIGSLKKQTQELRNSSKQHNNNSHFKLRSYGINHLAK